MKVLRKQKSIGWVASLAAPLFLFWLAPGGVASQEPAGEHQEHAGVQDQSLEQQLAELRTQVAQLQEALNSDHKAGKQAAMAGKMPMKGMGKMKGMKEKKKGMGMGMGKKGMSGKMPMKKMGMKKMGKEKMRRMKMMGKMAGGNDAEPASMVSTLPGFPGASHIYHIGASGYFLDHADMVELSKAQRRDLARLQEKSMLNQADLDRRIEQAEQDLWVLTSAGEPDAPAIEKKVHEIAALEAEQRLSFIQGVGKAARVLTKVQRDTLVGDLESSFADKPMDMESKHDH